MISKCGGAEKVFSNSDGFSNVLSGRLGIEERKCLHYNYISVYLIKLLSRFGIQK